jgi:hypothetical protein
MYFDINNSVQFAAVELSTEEEGEKAPLLPSFVDQIAAFINTLSEEAQNFIPTTNHREESALGQSQSQSAAGKRASEGRDRKQSNKWGKRNT